LRGTHPRVARRERRQRTQRRDPIEPGRASGCVGEGPLDGGCGCDGACHHRDGLEQVTLAIAGQPASERPCQERPRPLRIDPCQQGQGGLRPGRRCELRRKHAQQTLALCDERGRELKRYSVSTSRNGPGEMRGSYCTPRGRHVVRARIGAGQPVNTVFVRRRPTGEVWTPELGAKFPGRDWILTRILWLSGCEPGFNRLGAADTMRRFIYIHGSPDAVEMGRPGSIGCIRMRNADILALFELATPGTPVHITGG